MRQHFTTASLSRLRFIPGAILGLFVARAAGEVVGLPSWLAAAAIGLFMAVAGSWLLGKWPLARTWPTLVLLAYVVYPEVNHSLAAWSAVVALAALAFTFRLRRSSTDPGDKERRRTPLANLLVELVLFAVFLALYVATLAPGVLAADSGELQVVAAQLGVAHPPGFPLYIMLAHLFTRLPFESAALAVNFFSALTSALTVVVVYRAGLELSGRWPALLGSVALGTAATFWSQATTANVRSLTALFAALILYALLRYRVAVRHPAPKAAGRWLTTAALFMGFGLTHHISLAFVVLVGLLFVTVIDSALWRQPRRWGASLAAGLLGLLPLLYLPLRAGAAVRGASADLATVPGFLEHVLATGFRGDLFYYVQPALLWERLLIMFNVMTFQFAPLLLVGMLAGLVSMLRRSRETALLLGGCFAVYTLVAATYRAPQTVEYMMPAYVPAALSLACACGSLERWSRATRRSYAPAVAALALALIAASVLHQGIGHLSASGARHEGQTVRTYATQLLDNAPTGSVILAHWHWATPLWYLQEIDGLRPDVEVRFVFPEGEPYEDTWARRTSEEFAAGRPVITTYAPVTPLAGLPPAEPLGEALLYPQEPRQTLPHKFTPVGTSIGGTIEVLGYRVGESETAPSIGDELALTVAWKPLLEPMSEAALYLHLVGPDGNVYAQSDRVVRAAADGVTLTQFRLTPRPGTPAGAVTIFAGVSGVADGREALAQLHLAPARQRPYTAHPAQRRLATGSDTLVGYDWDHTLAERHRLYLHWRNAAGEYRDQVVDEDAFASLALEPYRGAWGVPVTHWKFPKGQDGGHYVPFGEGIVWTGETLNGVAAAVNDTLTIDQEFHSARSLNRDYVISVRLIGLEPDGFHWAWWDLQDSVPALGAIPTLKWLEGSFVRSPHRVTVAPSATPGQPLTGALTLYDAFTNRSLPILDERITADFAWVPLCQGEVTP